MFQFLQISQVRNPLFGFYGIAGFENTDPKPLRYISITVKLFWVKVGSAFWDFKVSCEISEFKSICFENKHLLWKKILTIGAPWDVYFPLENDEASRVGLAEFHGSKASSSSCSSCCTTRTWKALKQKGCQGGKVNSLRLKNHRFFVGLGDLGDKGFHFSVCLGCSLPPGNLSANSWGLFQRCNVDITETSHANIATYFCFHQILSAEEFVCIKWLFTTKPSMGQFFNLMASFCGNVSHFLWPIISFLPNPASFADASTTCPAFWIMTLWGITEASGGHHLKRSPVGEMWGWW